MSKLTRLLAVGALTAVPGAVATSTAAAQTPAQYAPAAPKPPSPAKITELFSTGLDDKIVEFTYAQVFGPKALTITFPTNGAGAYAITLSSRLPGKKTTVVSTGNLVVAPGTPNGTGTIKLKARKAARAFLKSKKVGNQIPVTIVSTFTPPGGAVQTVTARAFIVKAATSDDD